MTRIRNERTALGDRLRAAREMAGLTQIEVARDLRVHRPGISETETGRRGVSADELRALAGIYQVGVDWLLGVVPRAGTLLACEHT